MELPEGPVSPVVSPIPSDDERDELEGGAEEQQGEPPQKNRKRDIPSVTKAAVPETAQ